MDTVIQLVGFMKNNSRTPLLLWRRSRQTSASRFTVAQPKDNEPHICKYLVNNILWTRLPVAWTFLSVFSSGLSLLAVRSVATVLLTSPFQAQGLWRSALCHGRPRPSRKHRPVIMRVVVLLLCLALQCTEGGSATWGFLWGDDNTQGGRMLPCSAFLNASAGVCEDDRLVRCQSTD